MFDWLRRRRKPPAIPDALWHGALSRYPFLALRRDAELQRLRLLTGGFLASKEFHGAQGLRITDQMAVDIAAQAVLPVLHLGLDWYDDFVGIVVHPEEVVAHRESTDAAGVVHQYDEVLAGEAMENGPVMLNWRDVANAGATARQGYNVVIHEFVHKLDMRDGAADGCPPLPSARARREWMAVLQPQYEAFRERVIMAKRFGGPPTWLDPYGGESISEFFAVASEAYFVNRPRFTEEFEAMAHLLDSFFAP